MNNENQFTYRGKVHHADRLQTFKSGFKKRTIVCYTKTQGRDKEYTNYAVFDAVGEAAAKTETLKNGDEVQVTFRLDGRAWKKDDASPTRWFGSATALKVELMSVSPERSEPRSGRYAGCPNAGSLTGGDKAETEAEPEPDWVADDVPF